MSKLFHGVVRLLSSYGLSVSVLLLLALLTFLGTLAQVDLGLYGAQKRYFDSWFLVERVFDVVAVPLPGGQLLMVLLGLNLLVGGMLRMQRNRRTKGILIVHIGIAVLLIAGYVKYYHAYEGHLTLYEGEVCSQFESHYTWEVAISRQRADGKVEERLIPQERFADLRGDRRESFREADLPFVLELGRFMPNCQVKPKGPAFEVQVPVVDGFYLSARPPEVEAEQNIAGVYAAVVAKSGKRQESILWGWSGSPSTADSAPWVVEVDGEPWAIELRHQRFDLPYSIRLDDFTAEFHPRTTMASKYESLVSRGLDDNVQPVRIQMNEPLRDGHYVVFQSNYGPRNAPAGTRMYSGFSVVYNPSDHWPLAACIIIAVGLLMHFGSKLFKFTRSEARRAS